MSVRAPEAPALVVENDARKPPPSEPGPPRRRFELVLLAAIAAIALAFLLRGLAPEEAPPPPPIEAAGNTVRFLMEQQWAVRMKLSVAETKIVSSQIRSTGRVVPAFRHHAVVASPLSGTLLGTTLPRVGQRVRKDQLLARIVGSPEAQSIASAQALLAIERARIEAEKRRLTENANEARARMLLTIVEADHAQRLFDRKAYSLNQYQKAQHDLKIAETDYDAARRALQSLEALEIPEISQVASDYAVEAPLSGTVVSVTKQIGERVGAGEPILEIVDLSRLWVEAPVFERDLSRLRGSLSVSFTTAAEPDRRFEGSVVDVGAIVDEASRAATVIFEVDNPERVLRVGMQANVAIETGERFEAVVVPEEAVLEIEGQPHVYVLVSGEEFERREVELAPMEGKEAVVREGLAPGERVVTQGAYQIRLHELSAANAPSHNH